MRRGLCFANSKILSINLIFSIAWINLEDNNINAI